MINTCCPSITNNSGLVSGGQCRVDVINTDENLYIPSNAYDNNLFWYALNSDYLDSSQNQLDGTNYGSSFDYGVFCLNSIYLKNNDYVEIEPDILLDDYPFSFACWCRFDSLPKHQGMTLWSDGRIDFGIDFRGKLDVITQNRITNIAIKENFAVSTDRLNINTWYFVGFSYYKGEVKIYLNGELASTKQFDQYILGDIKGCYLGRNQKANYWQGNIQSARLTSYMPDAYFSTSFKNICDYDNFLSYGAELDVDGDVLGFMSGDTFSFEDGDEMSFE